MFSVVKPDYSRGAWDVAKSPQSEMLQTRVKRWHLHCITCRRSKGSSNGHSSSDSLPGSGDVCVMLGVSLGTYPMFLVNSDEIRKPNKGTLHIREG